MHLSEREFRRDIAVGDLHGYPEPLRELLRLVRPSGEDLLVFIGDYVDRGPDARGVLDVLLRLRGAFPGTVFLKGNHQDMMLGSMGFPAVVGDLDAWLYNGGDAPLACCGIQGEGLRRLESMREEGRADEIMARVPRGHLQLLPSLRLYLETERFFFCHAGADPSPPQERARQNPCDLLWRRDHLLAGDRAWEKTLVCGHTPLPEPVVAERLVALDTGLYAGGPQAQGVMRLRSRGKIDASRTFPSPRIWAVMRSSPMARPPWGGTP
jgi:serine/threonine protein phosphatase 1